MKDNCTPPRGAQPTSTEESEWDSGRGAGSAGLALVTITVRRRGHYLVTGYLNTSAPSTAVVRNLELRVNGDPRSQRFGSSPAALPNLWLNLQGGDKVTINVVAADATVTYYADNITLTRMLFAECNCGCNR